MRADACELMHAEPGPLSTVNRELSSSISERDKLDLCVEQHSERFALDLA
jgi:hypothetical protein